MPNRNVNIIDTIDHYELIKRRKDSELLIRSPEGANFVLDIPVAEKIASILLFDEHINSRFQIPENNLTEKLTKPSGSYEVNPANLRQDRSLLAEIGEYTILPTSLHGKDFIHIRKNGVNFIMSIPVLFTIVERYISNK